MPAVDSRYDAERDGVTRQILRFLAAPAKDKRIAAFQPQHAMALPRQIRQQIGNVFLFAGAHAGGRLPAKIRPTPSRASLRSVSSTSASYRMKSAWAIACRPRVVIRPGSPGPAPTSQTQPGWKSGNPSKTANSAKFLVHARLYKKPARKHRVLRNGEARACVAGARFTLIPEQSMTKKAGEMVRVEAERLYS